MSGTIDGYEKILTFNSYQEDIRDAYIGEPKTAQTLDCLGTEYEYFLVDNRGRPASFDQCHAIMLELVDSCGWEPVEYNRYGIVVGIAKEGWSLVYEPGNQLELNSPPEKSVSSLVKKHKHYLDDLLCVAAAQNLHVLTSGTHPTTLADEILLNTAKDRYDGMKDFFKSRPLDMALAKSTCAFQVTVGARNSTEAMETLRLAIILSSLLAAATVNSPVSALRETGCLSERLRQWNGFSPIHGGTASQWLNTASSFEHYLEHRMDLPLVFVKRDERIIEAEGAGTLRETMAQPLRALLGAGYTHEESLVSVNDFLNAFTKPYTALLKPNLLVEFRMADEVPTDMAAAVTAVVKGIVYDPRSRARFMAFVNQITPEMHESFCQEIATKGLNATLGGKTTQQLLLETVFPLATAGLNRLEPEALPLLTPLEKAVKEGRTPAHDMLDVLRAAKGNVSQFVQALSLNADRIPQRRPFKPAPQQGAQYVVGG